MYMCVCLLCIYVCLSVYVSVCISVFVSLRVSVCICCVCLVCVSCVSCESVYICVVCVYVCVYVCVSCVSVCCVHACVSICVVCVRWLSACVCFCVSVCVQMYHSSRCTCMFYNAECEFGLAGQAVEDETELGYTEVPVPMIELVDVNADSWHQGRGMHHT